MNKETTAEKTRALITGALIDQLIDFGIIEFEMRTVQHAARAIRCIIDSSEFAEDFKILGEQ